MLTSQILSRLRAWRLVVTHNPIRNLLISCVCGQRLRAVDTNLCQTTTIMRKTQHSGLIEKHPETYRNTEAHTMV